MITIRLVLFVGTQRMWGQWGLADWLLLVVDAGLKMKLQLCPAASAASLIATVMEIGSIPRCSWVEQIEGTKYPVSHPLIVTLPKWPSNLNTLLAIYIT